MCLTLMVSVAAQDRELLERAAREATATGLSVKVEHPPKWPWARQAPVRATISEEGGCACSLLADDADWNADSWAMRPEILDRLAETIRILLEEGPARLTIEALWIGEAPHQTTKTTAAELVALARSSRLGTKTTYELVRNGA